MYIDSFIIQHYIISKIKLKNNVISNDAVFIRECSECPHCKSEESNICDLFRINTDKSVMMIYDQESRFSIKRKSIYHFVGTSTFCEYTVVHAGCVLVPLSMLQNQNIVFLLLFLDSELLVLLYVILYFSLHCIFYSYGSRTLVSSDSCSFLNSNFWLLKEQGFLVYQELFGLI
ncbi:hypothetical protein AHAS_Ahas12G0016500 [Arachis hypogaea]